MINMFSVQKVERSKLRRLPLLPRFGITVDIAGRQITYKHAPLLETVLNLRARGFSLKNLAKVATEELDEIRFPSVKRGLAAVKDLHAKASEQGDKLVKKAQAKAAAKKRPTAETKSAE